MGTGDRMYANHMAHLHQLSGCSSQHIVAPSADVNSATTRLRVYQAWRGNNVFCLGGRLIFGPDVRSLFLTVSLIAIPMIFFCAFVARSLITEFRHHLGNFIVIICVVYATYVVFLLLLTSSRDPGIVPRNSRPPEEDGSALSTGWSPIAGTGLSLPPTKDVVINGAIIKVKYCQTCMLYRPPRCSHCSICNNCVERFDHHCPWVGQCIGKRNYRFFFMFVISTTMLCLYVFAFCWVHITKIMGAYHCSLWRAFVISPVSGILIIYTFVCSWFVGGLSAFHMYLISTNQTTYENFRYRYDKKLNPYNLGCVRNVMEVFCTSIPKSKNNFREEVVVDPSRRHATPMRSARGLSPEMAKRSVDIEMGKRRAVADEDFEDIQSQIDSISGLERCETQPRHSNWNRKNNWDACSEVSAVSKDSDISEMAAEFHVEIDYKDRDKISGDH